MRYDEEDAPIREKIRTRVHFIKDTPVKEKPCITGKTRHKTRKRALSSQHAVLRNGSASFITVYKCPFCHDFHLTSRKPGQRGTMKR